MAEQIGLQGVFDLDQFDRGINDYIRGIKNADDATGRTEKTFGSAFDSMGKSVLHVAGLMTGAFVAAAGAATAAVGAFVVGGIKDASNLESQMGAIASIMGQTKEAVGPLKELIMDLGLDPTLKVNAEEAADAIEKLASNGLTMTQIMEGAAKSTVLLANSTGADFDTAASIATDSMALFNIQANDMMKAVNGITGVTVASKFGINDYKLALSQAGGVAAATGVNFDDFNASITGISNYFASGSDAGTSFKTMLLRLVPSTSAAEAAMGELGLTSWNTQAAMEVLRSKGIEPVSDNAGLVSRQLYDMFVSTHNLASGSEEAAEKFGKWAMETGVVQSAFFDANGQMKSMADISAILNGAIGDLSDQEKNKALSTIFGTDAMRAAVALSEQGEVAYTDQALAAKELGVSFESLNGVMEGGITKFEALQIQIGKTDAVESAKVRMDNFKGSMEILQGVIDTVGLQIGFAFLPVLKELADMASELITQYAPMITDFFEGFATGITAAVEAGDWTMLFPDWLSGTIILLVDNMEVFTGAIAGVAAVLVASAIPVALGAIGAAIAGLLSPISLLIIGAAALGAAWNSNFLGIKDATLAVIQPITDFITTVTNTGIYSEQTAEKLAAFPEPLQAIMEVVGQVVSGFTEYIAAIKDAGVFSIEAREALTIFPEVLQNIIGGVTETVAAFLNYVEAVGDAGLDSIEAGEALGLLKDSFLKLVDGVKGLLGEWVKTLASWAATVTAELLKIDYLQLGKDIITAIMDGWKAIAPTMATIVKTFTDGISTTVKSVDWNALGQAILNGIQAGWEAVKAGAASAIALIASGWKSQFGDSVQNWTQAGKDILDKVKTGMESAKAVILGTVTTVVTEMKNRYTTPEGFQWNTLGQDISNLVRDGLNAAARASAGIISTALTIATAIKDQFTSLTWSQIGDTIINAIKSGLETAARAASGLLETVKKLGQELITNLTEMNWEEVGRSIARYIKDGFKAIAEGLGGLIPTAKSTGESVKSAFADVDWIGLGKSIVNAIVTGVKAIAYGAAGLIVVSLEIAKGFSGEMLGFDWDNVGQTVLKNIQGGIETAKIAFMDLVRKIPTEIKKIFTDMALEFKNIGAAIVDGIGAGITGAKDSLMEKAKSLANSLPGWVKEVLGISSPSKVFMVIGSQIIEGLIVGIEGSAGALQSAMQRVTSTLSKEGLMALQFSASSTFADRLRDDYLTQTQDFLNKVQARRDELASTVSSLMMELQRPGNSATRQSDLITWLGLAQNELKTYSDLTAKTAQEVQRMKEIMFWGDKARQENSFLEDQIALMRQAKDLGIDVTGIGIGDTSIGNLTVMANIEKRIAELKRQQLEYTAQLVKTGGGENPIVKGLQQQVSQLDTFNSFLNSQLGLMKKAEDMGMDLLSVWNTYITFDPNDVQRQLEFQKKLGELTRQDVLNQMTAMIAEQKRVKGLEAAMKQLQPLIDQTNVSSVFGQRYKATVLDPLLRALEQAAGIDSERVRLMQEYTVAAQKLADMQKKEEQLNFLKEQMDVIKMIQDQDLVGGNSLFDGITFGVNASIDDLLTLTNRVLNSMIEEVKDTLGIHSPSAVFEDIGGRMMEGLRNGIQNNIMAPLSALRASTLSHGAVSTSTLNFAMGGVTINTPMDEVMFERRVMRIIERSI